MSDVLDTVTDPALRARLTALQERLQEGLAAVDVHHRLTGRPLSCRVIAGQTFEIVFREVPSIDEAEVLGVKRLIGEECFCHVAPQTAENLMVRFVVPLKSPLKGEGR